PEQPGLFARTIKVFFNQRQIARIGPVGAIDVPRLRRDGKCRPENGVVVTEQGLRAPDSGAEGAYQVIPAHAVLLRQWHLQFDAEFSGEWPGVVPFGVKNVPGVRDIIRNRSERQRFNWCETDTGRDHPPLPPWRRTGLLRHADKLVVVPRLDGRNV